MKALRLLCAVICLASYAAGEARASLISTFSSWNGTEEMHPFGFPSAATIGQTFTVVGAEVVLNNYSVYINDASPMSFRTVVMQWSNATQRAVGPILFQAIGTTNNNGGAGGFQKLIFNTGHLILTSGQTYVMFESVSEAAFYSAANANAQVAVVSVPANPYSGGTSVLLDDLGNPGAWTGAPWTLGGNVDLVFDATMSAPEPSSLALLGTAAVCFVARRRRRLVQDAAVGSRD